MQIDPSYQAPRPAWDSPASSPGTCRRSFRILERLRRRRPSQASTPRLLLYFSAATPFYLSPSFVAWPRWSPTPTAPLFLAAPPTLRELPVARPHASRRRRFLRRRPPGTVAHAVKRRCGAWRCPRHRRWCKDAAGAEHHRDDSADIQIGMTFR